MRVFRGNSDQIGPDPDTQHSPNPAVVHPEENIFSGQKIYDHNTQEYSYGTNVPHSFSNQGIPSATSFPSNDTPLDSSHKSKFPGVMRVFRRNNSKPICPDPNTQHIPSRAITLHEEILAKEQQALSTATTFPSNESLSDSSRSSKFSGVMNVFRGNSSSKRNNGAEPTTPAVALQEEIHAKSQQTMDESRKLGLIAVARRDAEYRSRVVQETYLVNKTETSRTTTQETTGVVEEEIPKMWMSQPIIEKELAARKQAISMMHDEELYKPVVSTATSSFA